MSRKIVQLGYGKMGKLVLNDLLKTAQFDQCVIADAGRDFLGEIGKIKDPRLTPIRFDVDDYKGLVTLFKDADVVVELLPVRYTMNVAKAAVEAGTNMVSSVFIIDWSVQEPAEARKQKADMDEIDKTAGEKGLTVLKEFGMDPGLDIVIAGEAIRQLDEVNVIYNYGAGFPEHRLSTSNPIGYKFTWSIVDTMCSYSIPGRIRKNGNTIDIAADAMFTPQNFHTLHLDELGGPLECFVNGDGDTLAELFPEIADTAETLGRFICRWPGHAALWEKLVQSGFVGTNPIEVNGMNVVPAEFCAALLGSQNQFHYGPDEKDVALIRSDVRGQKDGKPTRVIMQLVDYRDCETGYTAMQRTVAYPMSIGAQMILDGRIAKRGIANPSDVPYAPFRRELEKRGLQITTQIKLWDGSHEPATLNP
jgi:saccharopine dehydrogenase-like NADP-dependent oxidoreductase